MNTYSTRDIADMFNKDSAWWLEEGVRQGKFPCLRIGRQVRFTDKHVEEIAEILEIRPSAPASAVTAVPELAITGVTQRSQARHRTRKTA